MNLPTDALQLAVVIRDSHLLALYSDIIHGSQKQERNR